MVVCMDLVYYHHLRAPYRYRPGVTCLEGTCSAIELMRHQVNPGYHPENGCGQRGDRTLGLSFFRAPLSRLSYLTMNRLAVNSSLAYTSDV
jgi:hypothetical protein